MMARLCGHMEFMQSTNYFNALPFHEFDRCIFVYRAACHFRLHAMEHVEESVAKISIYSNSLVSSANSPDSLNANIQSELQIFQIVEIFGMVIVPKCAAFFPSLTFCTFCPDNDVRPQSNILNLNNNTIRFVSLFNSVPCNSDKGIFYESSISASPCVIYVLICC